MESVLVVCQPEPVERPARLTPAIVEAGEVIEVPRCHGGSSSPLRWVPSVAGLLLSE